MRASPIYLGLALSQALTLAGFLTLLGGLGAPLFLRAPFIKVQHVASVYGGHTATASVSTLDVMRPCPCNHTCTDCSCMSVCAQRRSRRPLMASTLPASPMRRPR